MPAFLAPSSPLVVVDALADRHRLPAGSVVVRVVAAGAGRGAPMRHLTSSSPARHIPEHGALHDELDAPAEGELR